MPDFDLITILDRHNKKDGFCAKAIAAALGYRSQNSAYNLLRRVPAWLNRAREFFKRLPKPIQHETLVAFIGDMPYAVTPRESCDGRPPLEKYMDLTKLAAEEGRDALEKLRGGLTAQERADLRAGACAMVREGQQILAWLDSNVPPKRAA